MDVNTDDLTFKGVCHQLLPKKVLTPGGATCSFFAPVSQMREFGLMNFLKNPNDKEQRVPEGQMRFVK